MTIDTSKRNRSTVLPGVTTLRPTYPPSPPPIRGTVPPISKWAPYDRYKPNKSSFSPTVPTTRRSNIRDWAKRMFNFSVEDEDPSTTTTTFQPLLIDQSTSIMTTGSSSSSSSFASTIGISTTGVPTTVAQSTTSVSLSSEATPSIFHRLKMDKMGTSTRSPKPITTRRGESEPSKSISLEELLLSTLDKLANQYKNSTRM